MKTWISESKTPLYQHFILFIHTYTDTSVMKSIPLKSLGLKFPISTFDINDNIFYSHFL